MRYSPFILVDVRKTTSDELKRHVMAEYRERDACWLTADNGDRSCLYSPANNRRESAAARRGEPCCDSEGPDSRSIALGKPVAARGGFTGNP